MIFDRNVVKEMTGVAADIDAAQLLRDLEAVEYEDSLYKFLKAGWRYIDPNPFVDSWHLEAIAEHLEAVCDGQIKRLIINQPPRTSKSSMLVAFDPWVWAQRDRSDTSGPGVQFLHASYAQNLSIRDSVKTRRLIESPWYQKYWGHRVKVTSDQNTKIRFDNNAGGYRLATSVGGTLTGEGGHCFVAGTMVSTPSGDVPIEALSCGQAVFAFDHIDNVKIVSHVVATKTREADVLYELTTSTGGSITCTGNHPVFVPWIGYVNAESLKVGDRVLREDQIYMVERITEISVHRGKPQPVYDIQVEGQSNFFANGVLAHNCIIVDDPHNAVEMESEVVRQSTLEWFDNSLSTRLNNPRTGAMIVVMQRLHEDDLTGHILAGEMGDEWVHLMLPMRYEKDRATMIYPNAIGWSDPREEEGDLLTPERYDEQSVKRLETQLGVYQSAGQLQQRPEPKGGGILKRDWWQDWESENYPAVSYVLASLDTAYTTKEENDYSAMTVWGVFTDDNGVPKLMLMNAWKDRLELHELVEKIAKTARRFRVDHMLIENKASGISVSQEMRRMYGYEDWSVQLVDPKGADKVSRAYSVQPTLADGLVYAPMAFSWADMVVTECGSFPKGKHDDITDSVVQALRFFRTTGMISRGEERTAELAESLVFHGNEGDKPLYPV